LLFARFELALFTLPALRSGFRSFEARSLDDRIHLVLRFFFRRSAHSAISQRIQDQQHQPHLTKNDTMSAETTTTTTTTTASGAAPAVPTIHLVPTPTEMDSETVPAYQLQPLIDALRRYARAAGGVEVVVDAPASDHRWQPAPGDRAHFRVLRSQANLQARPRVKGHDVIELVVAREYAGLENECAVLLEHGTAVGKLDEAAARTQAGIRAIVHRAAPHVEAFYDAQRRANRASRWAFAAAAIVVAISLSVFGVLHARVDRLFAEMDSHRSMLGGWITRNASAIRAAQSKRFSLLHDSCVHDASLLRTRLETVEVMLERSQEANAELRERLEATRKTEESMTAELATLRSVAAQLMRDIVEMNSSHSAKLRHLGERTMRLEDAQRAPDENDD
jgi:hypothetical protein